MNTIERLKELCERPIPTDGLDKITLDFEIQKATRKALPKLLAIIEAAEALADSISIRRRDRLFGDTSDLGQALIKYLKSQDAMNEEP